MSLQKGFFKTQSSNPILPPEEWTLDEEFTTAGSYSTSLDWGKYKIVISGGGGAGGASASTHDTSRNWANAGSAGEELTIMVSVSNGENKTVSGIIASGGGASYAEAQKGYVGHPAVYIATLGSVGTGYANGAQGTRATYWSLNEEDVSAAAGGSGGGSSSLLVDSVETAVAKGGNGGACRADQVSARAGGTGGSGGVSSGTGAAGGAGHYYRNGGGYSDAGSDGYVRIYKSNLYPEPL